MSYVKRMLAGTSPIIVSEEPPANPSINTLVRRGRKPKEQSMPIPITEPGVTLMRSPEKRRKAYILAGRINFHSEIIRVDADGFAHVKTVPGVIALRCKGFTVVEGA